VAKIIISRPRPPKPSTFCTLSTAREVEVLKSLHSFVRDKSLLGELFRQENLMKQNASAGSNFAKARSHWLGTNF
jgi:hypothetical protein